MTANASTNIVRHVLCVALACIAGACATAPKLPAGQRVGDAMRAREVHALAEVSTHPRDFYEHTVLIEARVEAVCQKRGCWMKVVDGASSAMVRWESGCGGAYAFPKDSTGKRVLLQGAYYPRKLSQAEIDHMAGESSKDVEFVADTHELNVSSVLVLDA
ncbi:MAG: DUF4920 domain-containing protein [Planctomycetota bacterium]|nr:MAG: DUF4920 domain-containing protein [Planctomycetota bacterium]